MSGDRLMDVGMGLAIVGVGALMVELAIAGAALLVMWMTGAFG